MGGWFSWDPGDGFVEHGSELEAVTAADAALDAYRDDAVEGWAEEVEWIRWGRICGRVVETSRRPVTEDDPGGFTVGYDDVVEYALVDDHGGVVDVTDLVEACDAVVQGMTAAAMGGDAGPALQRLREVLDKVKGSQPSVEASDAGS